jgi:hypothetical protein
MHHRMTSVLYLHPRPGSGPLPLPQPGWIPGHWWLGWLIAAALIASWLSATFAGWFRDQYEFTACRYARRIPGLRVTRRWYGTRAHVWLRLCAGGGDQVRYRVIRWDDESTGTPWLLVRALDDHIDCGSFQVPVGDEPFWAPVTDFAPLAVRRFRPVLSLRSRSLSPFWYSALLGGSR